MFAKEETRTNLRREIQRSREMRECELCGKMARMYCESDQASLCWDCDDKVHGANFLVAKHRRSLLCNICQSPTPWQASGLKLTPTVSVCQDCMRCHGNKCESIGDSDDVEEDVDGNEVDIFYSDDDDEIIEEDEDVEKVVENGENQVVPCPPSLPLPSPAESSSSSSEEEDILASKRKRHNADLEYSDDQDEIGYSLANSRDEATSCDVSLIGQLKRSRQTEDQKNNVPEESRSMEIISSLRRLQNDVITDVDVRLSPWNLEPLPEITRINSHS